MQHLKTFILSIGVIFIIAKPLPAVESVTAAVTPRKLTIAMWDFSWINCHYPGGSFEDWSRVIDEAKERGFNTVRIDAFPLLIDQLHRQGKGSYEIPARPLDTWGPSTKIIEHRVADELVEFMALAKRKGVCVILSTWNVEAKRDDYKKREDYWSAWERTLDLLQQNGLLEHVLYVDFDQEFPYFSPYKAQLDQLKDEPARADVASDMEQAGQSVGQWNDAQRRFVKDYFESTLSHFGRKYPGMRFTFSMTSFWEEARSLKLKGMGVLELHIWSNKAMDRYTGFDRIKKDRMPERDYKSYMDGIREALKHKADWEERMKQQLDFATEWSKELGVPLTTTEAWGPWWHMDHPDLEWQWLYDWCEYCMGLSGDYGFWGSTPWNFSHPYWENWANIEWYQRVNSKFLKSK